MKKSGKFRAALLGLAAVRVVLGIIAIPLAPVLYKEHFLVLILLRPTKEVLLAAGFLIRLDKIWWVPVIAAAVPLAILGVWQFYYLGRQYASEIASGSLPWWAKKLLPSEKVKLMQGLLERKGMKLVMLGRLAVFPSSLVAAAAGSGDVPSRSFLSADLIGGLLSIAEVIGAGYLLGQAYKDAGPWITVAGFAALAVIAVIVARGLRKESKRQKRASSTSRSTSGAKKKPKAKSASAKKKPVSQKRQKRQKRKKAGPSRKASRPTSRS